MKVSIIAIGDELLIGQVTDTNSGFIARHIAPYGWDVADVQVVADNASQIERAIERAFESSSVIITTGGLGPTRDDITKNVLCRYFGGSLQLNNEVLENVNTVVAKRGLKLNDLTAAQAIVPTSCKIIQNRVGTAPILWFETQMPRRVLVAMPGVPFETREMFSSEVFPKLLNTFQSGIAVEHRTIMVSDISESLLATHLSEWEDALPPHLHLAYLPKPGLIRLRIDGHHANGDLLRTDIERYKSSLIDAVKENLLYDGDKTPEEILIELLIKRHETVATAESCTGGNIAHRITEIPGCSAAMSGGIVAYSNEVKQNLLGVTRKTLIEYGAVSIPVAEQMAQGVRKATGSDIGIATSGIAGPTGATVDKPIGTVCIAVSTPTDCISNIYHFPGDRSRVIDRASTTALILAIRSLQ